jgi:CDP-diacylglycerol--serine O-phosphatidyltransferase
MGAGDHVPEGAPEPARRRPRGIYLLPNLITTAALFSGVYAIVAAADGRFEAAGWAVFAAMVLDALDGRVARLTRTESRFGAEYDSLSDMVAFGVAPALIALFFALKQLGSIGWLATFTYVACTALRLARFNTAPDSRYFTGLASPSAAAIVTFTVWTWSQSPGMAPSTAGAYALALLTALTGLFMVSGLRYFSPKQIDFRGRISFISLVAIVLLLAVVLSDPPRVLLLLFVGYALSGPVTWLARRVREQRRRGGGHSPTDPMRGNGP